MLRETGQSKQRKELMQGGRVSDMCPIPGDILVQVWLTACEWDSRSPAVMGDRLFIITPVGWVFTNLPKPAFGVNAVVSA